MSFDALLIEQTTSQFLELNHDVLPSANELRHARLHCLSEYECDGVHARPVISTIIRRESHWQSRVLRNDRH
jgi:hypothetical protein